MGVVIRLARHGRKKLPFYRIVATDKQMPRDGRYLELLGTMNPLTDPAIVKLKADRVKYWMGVGAVPSATVRSLINREIPGLLKELSEQRLEKVRAVRAKRKARVAKAGKKTGPSPKKLKAAKKAEIKAAAPKKPKKKPVVVAKPGAKPGAKPAGKR